jgi:hypothetical protein
LWPPTLSRARKQRQFLRANDLSVRTLKHLQRGEIPKISHPLRIVDAAQRIRTAASIPVVVTIVDAGSTPAFLEIAAKAAHLRELGMSDRAIARVIGVSDKTVAKSLRRVPHRREPRHRRRGAGP